MSLLALTKLLYLAERESMRRYAEPLTGDTPVSMEYGPVLSRTLNLTNGLTRSDVPGGWDRWIADREGHDVALRDSATLQDAERDLPALSRADLNVLADTWAEFGHMDRWELVAYTHQHCREWEDPGASSSVIPPVRLFRALGYTDEQVEAAVEHMEERAALQRALA